MTSRCVSRAALHETLTAMQNGDTQEKPLVHVSKHPGNGAVAIRRDGRVCAVGGWDGKLVSERSVSLRAHCSLAGSVCTLPRASNLWAL